MIEIFKDFRFEAAHRLPNVHKDHQCSRLHGHSFQARVTLRGEPDAQSGWLIDFADLKDAWRPLHDLLDHRYLNDVEGLENPTSEVLAAWVATQLSDALGNLLHSVTVRETCTSGATWTRPTS